MYVYTYMATKTISITREAYDRLRARKGEGGGEPIYLPTPVLFELWEGVSRSERPREEAAKVREFAAGHDLLPFGDADAPEAGLLSGRLSRSGRMMGTVDVQIAGMA